MYQGYGFTGYPVYSDSVWDGYGPYGYAFRSDMDSPNLVLAGGASWSCDFDFAPNRNGTGVFFPKSEHGTGVFHPKLELLGNPNRVDRRSNIGNPNRVDQKSNLVNPNRVDQESNLVSIDVLPDELQEQILTLLPLACTVGASCVCKKWKHIVYSGKFKMNSDDICSKKPWYFMFKNSDELTGHIYDPVQRHWYPFVFPFNLKDTWKIAASSGLICSMQENDCNLEISICNPMTKKCRKFEERLGAHESTYSSLAFSIDQPSGEYTIAVVRSWQVQDSFSQWNASIHIYNSEKMTWLPPFVETVSWWRSGNDSIIFDGVLYFAVTKICATNCHALLSYNLKSLSSNCKLIKTLIPIPFSLTCLRLMNLQNKIVMVGGLGSHDVPEKIGIWMLKGTEWEEVSLVPDNFIKGFGELDDVFASSGTGDLIYIHTYGSTSLLVFDIKLKVWKWCQKYPLSKRWHLQLFSGFCFEPRLDVSP